MAETFGATGKFPQGKVDPSDEGELQYGIAADLSHGTVVLNFGKPVAWMAFPPESARELAAALIKTAAKVEAQPRPGVPV